MKRILAFSIAVGLLAAACAKDGTEGGGPSGPGGAVPTPTGASPEPSAGSLVYEVWFHYGESLFVTERTGAATPQTGTAAVSSLLQGPSEAERAAGVETQVPDGTELLGLSIENGIATVDLSDEYASGGGSATMFMRLAQVVYTLTQFPTVEALEFAIDGEPVTVFSSEGIALDGPQTRRDYRDLLPPVLVERPRIGERATNPVRISGTANVFEATVSIRILDEDGDAIADTFTTATCGTGCRGTYSEDVAYTVDHEQPGIVMVFESSAENGEPLFPVEIPVTLTP